MPASSQIYEQRTKPARAPSAEVFGPVWTVLYLLIAGTYGRVAYLFWRKRVPRKVVLPFVINLFANLLFTYLQFGLQNMWLATVDILVVLGTIIWSMIAIRPYKKAIAILQTPYLVRVMIATVLQISILFANM